MAWRLGAVGAAGWDERPGLILNFLRIWIWKAAYFWSGSSPSKVNLKVYLDNEPCIWSPDARLGNSVILSNSTRNNTQTEYAVRGVNI